ncbi:hypothetical protein P4S72_08825 [Vibrio sp. PP-XX7]
MNLPWLAAMLKPGSALTMLRVTVTRHWMLEIQAANQEFNREDRTGDAAAYRTDYCPRGACGSSALADGVMGGEKRDCAWPGAERAELSLSGDLIVHEMSHAQSGGSAGGTH